MLSEEHIDSVKGILAQPERCRRADTICGQLPGTPNQKIAQSSPQVPYQSRLILTWINIMLDP
jgi:hypothetical protein